MKATNHPGQDGMNSAQNHKLTGRSQMPQDVLARIQRAPARVDAAAGLRRAAGGIVVTGQTSKMAPAGRAKP